jgi:hypothetical protein
MFLYMMMVMTSEGVEPEAISAAFPPPNSSSGGVLSLFVYLFFISASSAANQDNRGYI